MSVIVSFASYRQAVNMGIETVSLIVGIVGGVVTLVAFFAAVMFYHQGHRINRTTEQLLARIDAQVGVIQGDYWRIVDRTLSLAEKGSGTLVATLSGELTSVADSLKHSIAETIRATRSPTTGPGDAPTATDLEGQIAAIIDSKMSAAKQEATRIIEISGYRASYDGIVRLVLRSLRHGPIVLAAVQRYMHSHCFDMFAQDLGVLICRLEAEGLVERREDLNVRRTESAVLAEDGFWAITVAGRAFPGVEDRNAPII